MKIETLRNKDISPDVLLAQALEYVQENGVHGVAIVIGIKDQKGHCYPLPLYSHMPMGTLLTLKEALNAEITSRFTAHLAEAQDEKPRQE